MLLRLRFTSPPSSPHGKVTCLTFAETLNVVWGLSPTPSQSSRTKSPQDVPFHFYSNLNGRRIQEFPVRFQCPAGSTELTIQSSLLFIFTQSEDVWPTETQRHNFTTICEQSTNEASSLLPYNNLGLCQSLQQVTKTHSDTQNDDDESTFPINFSYGLTNSAL